MTKQFLRIIFLAAFFLVALLFWRKESKFWNGSDKLSLVINGREGIRVVTFDPGLGEVTTLTVPGEVEVNVAHDLGVFRLKSVWQLGINEKLGGTLLAQTVTKNFDFPVFVWADTPASGFTDSKGPSLVAAALLPYKTNLGVVDKVRIALFVLGVKNTQKETVDLSQSTFLRKTVLKDGEVGYVTAGLPPPSISAIFSDKVANLNLKTEIKTSDNQISQKIGEIVEVLGPKIALVSREKTDVLDCLVSGKYKDLTLKVARIFDCKIGAKPQEGNFDLTIEAGEDFSKRF